MTIYLYVKTHKKTGLKYLGQTSATDPHRYHGSGVYWKNHLKVHGFEYDTVIIKECHSKDELKQWGMYYSKLWNVVESKEWANLKEEVGDGGRQSIEVRRKIGEAGKGRIPWNKGKHIWSDEDKKRIGEQNRLRGPQTEETINKRIAKTTGKVRTTEQKKVMSDAQKGKTLTEEHKLKLQESRKKGFAEGTIVPWNKGKKSTVPSATAKNWMVIFPDGRVEKISSLRKWALNNSLSYQMLHRNATLGKSFKGYFVFERVN